MRIDISDAAPEKPSWLDRHQNLFVLSENARGQRLEQLRGTASI
jgi:hypothetical protein